MGMDVLAVVSSLGLVAWWVCSDGEGSATDYVRRRERNELSGRRTKD